MRNGRALLVAAACVLIAAGPAPAATVYVRAFGDDGWKADDTRDSGGTDLVGINYTHYGKPGQTPTAADDAVIAQQIQFDRAAPGARRALKMDKQSVGGGYSKCTLSKVDTGGFAESTASTSWAAGFTATYDYYTNSTAEATVLKIGVQSPLWGTGAGQSQNGFTAARTGESVWDLILVDWRGTQPGFTVNAWDTFSTDAETDCWMVYRQAGNGFFNDAYALGPQSLADWAAETTVAVTVGETDCTWAQVLFGEGAKAVSLQLGVGSSTQTSTSYVDYLEASILHGGERVDFIPEPATLGLLGLGGAGVLLRRRRRT